MSDRVTRHEGSDPDFMERSRRAIDRAFRTDNVLSVRVAALRRKRNVDPEIWEVTVTLIGRPVDEPDPERLPFDELEAMQARLHERLQMVERELLRRTEKR